MDGYRDELYTPGGLTDAMGSLFQIMRDEFMARARARGYEVVDMAPIFKAAYERDQCRFDYAMDGHWNGHAHELAAEAVSGTGAYEAVFGPGR